MSDKQHEPDEAEVQGPDDLDENPGIGQSKGLFARAGSEDSDLLAGENTIEGDVENDSSRGDGADSDVGRENP